MGVTPQSADRLPPFDRTFTAGVFSRIGSGWIGGKAQGLAFVKDLLAERMQQDEFPDIRVRIPTITVLATDIFDQFLKENRLYDLACSDSPDETIANAFQKAEIPPLIVGDLRALTNQIHLPLAVRSSSLFEDALQEPFAGVYATKMIPNNQHDPDTRFRILLEAIKFVFASTFFKEAKTYIATTGQKSSEEKMAVILQEVVGVRYRDRYYPHISGVARSYNFYATGHAKPQDGAVTLALGLGKTIVDGGRSWTYSPASPRAIPPFKSAGELLKGTQTEFWAVNMGKPPAYDPIHETEYLVHAGLKDAEEDETLRFVASTFQPENDRLVPGIRGTGPRVLNFAPLLHTNLIPLNALMKRVIKICEEAAGHEVEIEFAAVLDPRSGIPAQFNFLQVRPMFVSRDEVQVHPKDLTGPDVLVASERVLGNGVIQEIRDVVFLKPATFTRQEAYAIARDLEAMNHELLSEKRPYLLMVYGRLGTTDPPFGIPVDWWQVSGAKVIVESTLPEMNIELSQGSHFFHNVISSRVAYFSVPHDGKYAIQWEWFQQRQTVTETEFLRHVDLDSPLLVKIDGRTSRGMILKSPP